MIYWIGYILIWTLGAIFFPRSIYDAKNIPTKGACIFASNHLSNLDPLIIGLCCHRRITYLAKASLFKNKILRFFLYKVETFPIRRDEADIGALREALKRLRRGLPLVLFPEGTRQQEGAGQSADVQPGIGFLAAKSQLPVIPVHISGSQKVLPPGKKMFRRHRVQITFGKPVEYARSDSFQDIANHIMRDVHALG